MYLTSLTLRGFKSFAEPTTIQFEPGITAIVGPNGSGKSNIVDALMWVLGTRSARQLRGSAMSDVIFAGNAHKRAMGRASIDITINNADGRLPIDYAEVTIGRSIYRNGDGGATIHNEPVRQLDVAELLSDTGLGRESHTIVGQGKIDGILNARPEERRFFIEEAAGIVKHRQRKDRAIRKLAMVDTHLERLGDIQQELARSLRPLRRQAKAARTRRLLDIRLTDIRLEQYLRAWQQASDAVHTHGGIHEDALAQRQVLAVQVTELLAQVTYLSEHVDTLGPAVRRATETTFALTNLAERAKGVLGRIQERQRGLVLMVDEPIPGSDPAVLHDQAKEALALAEATDAQVVASERVVQERTEAVARCDQAVRLFNDEASMIARARAKAAEDTIRWEASVASAQERVEQAKHHRDQLADQLPALDQAILDAQVLCDEAKEAHAQALEAAQAMQASETTPAMVAQAKAAMDEAGAKVAALRLREREATTTLTQVHTQLEGARAASATMHDAVQAVITHAPPGLLGTLMDTMRIDPAYAKALTAVLGDMTDALVFARADQALDALDWLDDQGKRAWALSVDEPLVEALATSHEHANRAKDTLFMGPQAVMLRSYLSVVDGVDGRLEALWDALIGHVVVVPTREDAREMIAHQPTWCAVTPDGFVVGAAGMGGRDEGSLAEAALAARARAGELEAALADAQAAHTQVVDAIEQTMEERNGLRDEHARLAQVASGEQATRQGLREQVRLQEEALARAEGGVRAAHGQVEAARGRLARQDEVIEEAEGALARLQGAPPTKREDITPVDKAHGMALQQDLALANEALVQAKVALSSVSSQAQELHHQADGYAQQAADIEAQRAAYHVRQAQRQHTIKACDELVMRTEALMERIERSRNLGAIERDRLDDQRQASQAKLGVQQQALDQAQEQSRLMTEAIHQQELVRHTLETTLAASVKDLERMGIADPGAVAKARDFAMEQGKAVVLPDTLLEDDDTSLLDQAAQVIVPLEGIPQADTETLRDWETDLAAQVAALGAINPLALQEYTELSTRQAFYETQAKDLRQAQRDLAKLIDTVDEHITTIFNESFIEVKGYFEQFFAQLFPGGTGTLKLTESDDPLLMGIEIAAKPAGKNVPHMNLLSGGERSLTALALLFAIFAALPSPFYVLDEVEAALDDANLDRFLTLLQSMKQHSQWIVVTHQRRTMAIADMLHGVSMGSEGVSRVISQKLGDTSLAGAPRAPEEPGQAS